MLKEMKVVYNPYKIGTCAFWVFDTIAKMPLKDTVKISSVNSRCGLFYDKKTIGQAMLRIEKDGYLKKESQNSITGNNSIGEKIYIKFGQIKGE